MKHIMVIILLGLFCQSVHSQKKSVPIESLFTGYNFYYQHTLYKKIGSSKFSFFNLTSLKTDYRFLNKKNSYLVRNQLFYKIHPNFNIGLTGELSSFENAARLGIQYLFKNKTFTIIVYPNLTVANEFSFVNMIYFEYKPKINKRLNLYTRVQIQTTTFFKGNTKYSNLYRLGIEYKTIRFGIGMPWFDPFNTKKIKSEYIGVFAGMSI